MWALVQELHNAPHRVALLVLWSFLACGLWTTLTRGRLPVIVLLLMASVWLLTDSSMEGDILLRVTPSHGLTRSDLAAPVVVAIALAARLIRP